MQRRTFVSSVAAAGATLVTSNQLMTQTESDPATPTTDAAPAPGSPPLETGYAPVNGLEMYFEIHGSGEPLVLLHGAFGAIDLWGPFLPTLAESNQVIAVEFQGHGHTADIDRPFSYEDFADDVAALMDHLDLPQADIVGYSLGANTGLQLAIGHPDLVRRMVLISGNYRHDAYYPEVYETIEMLTPELFAGSPLEASYLASAPNPENWPGLIERMKVFDATEFAWPESELEAVTAPALIIIGDSDNIRPEHAVDMFRLLGGGVPGDLTGLPPSRLAILPGITHVTINFEETALTLAMITRFLAEPQPAAA